MSKDKLNIYQKLLEIQKQVKALDKDKQAFGYKYVTSDKVNGFIKPLMNDLGLLLKQEILSIENTRQDYQTKNGSKSEILSKVMMRFTWVDADTGDKDENLFGANGQNDWDKGVGSALTYGERYFLLKYFHIATDEDDVDNPNRKEISETYKTEVNTKEYISNVTASIQGTKDLEQLKQVWINIPEAWKPTFLEIKDAQKEELTPKK